MKLLVLPLKLTDSANGNNFVEPGRIYSILVTSKYDPPQDRLILVVEE